MLNRMRLWKNVLNRDIAARPTVLLLCTNEYMSRKFLRLTAQEWKSKPKFIVEYLEDVNLRAETLSLNVTYCDHKKISDEERIKRWRNIDIAFIEDVDSEMRYEALLSGVTVVSSLEKLIKMLKRQWQYDVQTRISNFEFGSKLLDK